MSDLGERLERLGLAQYLDAFVSEGFDTWDTVLDITESDLNALNVKLGHRRLLTSVTQKLQRAIADYRGQSPDRPLPLALNQTVAIESAYRSDDSAPEPGARQQPESSNAASVAPNAKRRYRRHPKPDENAPDRPPSAYVIFSNQVRETLKGQDLSFTEIAKVVGERWQVLDPEAREACERQATLAKEKYYAELNEYKKTPEYEAYQKYLEEFKAKHGPSSQKETKRPKLETEASTPSSAEQISRPSTRRISAVQSDAIGMSPFRPKASPHIPPVRLPSAPLYPSQSDSPAMHSASAYTSPRTGDLYSPTAMSPRSAIPPRETSHDFSTSAVGREPRAQPDNNPMFPPAYAAYHPYSAASPPVTHSTPSSYQMAPIELPTRRFYRESAGPPSLTHDETTMSSEGAQSTPGSASYPALLSVPPADSRKAMRMLPHPLNVTAPTPTPSFLPTSSHLPDYRNTSSLAALVRAGELARAADGEQPEERNPPPN
ncbi:uncharacterized protein EI97DRAFT_453962 [Westerdykella ornata]|uniref:HMG box domain-containing protein n=1 Tax=Westerdykella ornata TaxID=318751 RepID=A0A6A6JVS4_WESOR|nr:uncharacterized protein EI97DRAFT_453962 [Westerdykella ornata]KAF2280711.1 hypothetical protein EI97DRAFT_453962 [Westerdykella ornata]